MNRRNIGYAIALAALLISIPRYIATFQGIDHAAWTAYGMGVLLAGGAAYIFDAWADARRRGVHPENRALLLVAFGINLIYEPFILTPFVLSRLWSQSLAQVMSNGYAVFWSVLVAAAPVILVAGLVLAINHQHRPNKRNADKSDDSTTDSVTVVEQTFTCDVCGYVANNRQALAGHMNKHRNEEPSE